MRCGIRRHGMRCAGVDSGAGDEWLLSNDVNKIEQTKVLLGAMMMRSILRLQGYYWGMLRVVWDSSH